jgi:tryptophanyl-tRNA synthetase
MPAGVRNLFDLLEQFGQKEDYQNLKKQYHDGSIKYAELKAALSDAVSKYFAPMRKKRQELMDDRKGLERIFQAGAAKAGKTAAGTLLEIKHKVGLV